MRQYLKIILFFTGIVCCQNVAWAMLPVIDVANLAQNGAVAAHTLQSMYNEAQMIENQYTALENWQKMLKDFNIHQLSDITGQLQTVGNIAQEGSALTYSTQNINHQFTQLFGGNTTNQTNAPSHFSQIFNAVLDTTRGTLNATSQQMDYTSQASGGLDTIVQGSNAAGGTKAVLQGTNQLLDASAAQLQSLKQLQAQQMSQQATYDSAMIAQQQQEYAADQQLMNYASSDQPYESNAQLNLVPDFNG